MKRTRNLLLAGCAIIACFFLYREQRLAAPGPKPAQERAKNVILFLGDGLGLPTIHAASIHGHQRAQALFIQSLPHVGFSDTSSANNWVTDSAAGMTAIMTGTKTLNGVIGQGPQGAVRGTEDGPVLKTLLEYAEERGLSTGLVTNDEITGATPASCYAHVNDRKKTTQIAEQLLQPRFGDGVEVLVAVGRKAFLPREEGGERTDRRNLLSAMRERGYRYLETPEQFLAVDSGSNAKVAALFAAGPYQPEPVVAKAIAILSRNPRGFLLMVEWDSHQKQAEVTLENALRLDRSVERARKLTNPRDTLVVVTADHSYDLRVTREAKIGSDILPSVNIGGHHAAEEVLAAADGPGADAVRGFLRNTDLFHVMKNALGW